MKILPESAPERRSHLEFHMGLQLTRRQAQVLALLIQGKPNKLIGRELELAEGTVKVHVTAILKALHVSNRTQAAVAANRMNIGAS